MYMSIHTCVCVDMFPCMCFCACVHVITMSTLSAYVLQWNAVTLKLVVLKPQPQQVHIKFVNNYNFYTRQS